MKDAIPHFFLYNFLVMVQIWSFLQLQLVIHQKHCRLKTQLFCNQEVDHFYQLLKQFLQYAQKMMLAATNYF